MEGELMTCENKIATELMSIISNYFYTDAVQSLSPRDAVSPDSFSHILLSQDYWIDTHKTWNGNLVNTNCLFDYFSLYSEQDGDKIRMEMITHMKLEEELYNKVG